MWINICTVSMLMCLSCINGQKDKIKTDLTMDQIFMRTMGGTAKAVNSLTLPEKNKNLVELDMIISDKQYEALYGNSSTSGRKKRKAVVDTTVYWTNGRVPYKLAPGHFNVYERWMLKVAMREWEKYTCLRFYEAKPSDVNYVYFQDGLGCNSQLGMVGGRQILNLDKRGCRFKGLYLHEIAHALGVVHEHQRPIRDDYIKIIYDNVEPSMKIWFQKYNPSAIKSFNVDYELSSVMHYGITAFSGNGKQTIRALDKTREEEIGRVYGKELSFTDVEIINRMYKCVPESNDCDGKRCSGKGYLDQNCNCICPDGSQDCTVGKSIDNSCRNNGDTRESWLCFIWARQGECERNTGYMQSNCRKACGQCGDERKDLPDTLLCGDVYQEEICQKWKEEVGDCRVAEPFMKKYCKKTCGYCNHFVLDRVPPQILCANAYANDTSCLSWARNGECVVNERWMPLNCRKACFACQYDDDTIVTVKPGSTVPTRTPSSTRPTTRPPLVTTQPTTSKPREDCVDLDIERNCKIWADNGHCKLNPQYMEAMCMRSCKKCTVKGGSTTETENCVDLNTEKNNCQIWERDGQCDENPSYMTKYCRRSCNKCTEKGGSTASSTAGSITVKPTVTVTDPMDNCQDTNMYCGDWSRNAQCVVNPGYMLKFCPKSCRSCTAGLREAAAKVIADSEKDNNSGRNIAGIVSNTFVMVFIIFVLF